jgi:hypothetical protein
VPGVARALNESPWASVGFVKPGAEFITESLDKYGEWRCYIRDPDGYIIEVGQSKPEFKYG